MLPSYVYILVPSLQLGNFRAGFAVIREMEK
jgi:hypothetical protein